MAKIPPVTDTELQTVLSPKLFTLWQKTVGKIEAAYEMEKEWDKGGKAAKFLLRFRRGGKTLVTLIPLENDVDLMVVYGKDERVKFEDQMKDFSPAVVDGYQQAKTYHDGKWIRYSLSDKNVQRDLMALLAIKRRPNRK